MQNLKNTNELWGIVSYFNPEKCKSKYQNFKKFRESNKKQGLKLIVVECVFGNNSFEIKKEDTDIVVQVKSNSIMWQKERLLNIALKHLPMECKYVAWLDGDIVFLNDNWITETIDLLGTYKVVHLFDTVVRLKKDQKFTHINDFEFGEDNGKKKFGYIYAHKTQKSLEQINPGFAWAIRRDIIEQTGFYDRMIMGSGDTVMIHAMNSTAIFREDSYSKLLVADIQKWVHEFYNLIQGDVYYVNGILLHLYHGDIKNRLYRQRYKLIEDLEFDPSVDLVLNQDAVWEWHPSRHNLFTQQMKKYFAVRDEDDKYVCKIDNRIFKSKFKIKILSYIRNKRYSGGIFWNVLFFIKDTLFKCLTLFEYLTTLFNTFLKRIQYLAYRNKILKQYQTDKNFRKISFCITSMDRLSHIKETLIQNIKNNRIYPAVEFILLDYSSKDGLKDWVYQNCKRYLDSGVLKFYRIEGEQKFHMARAKNLAHSHATGDILCNLDADNFTNKDFAYFINHIFNKNKDSILTPDENQDQTDIGGRICISKQNFEKLNGYDEEYVGWGMEDLDFKKRAIKNGLVKIDIPLIFLDAIKHDDDLREKNMILSKEESYRKNLELYKKKYD